MLKLKQLSEIAKPSASGVSSTASSSHKTDVLNAIRERYLARCVLSVVSAEGLVLESCTSVQKTTGTSLGCFVAQFNCWASIIAEIKRTRKSKVARVNGSYSGQQAQNSTLGDFKFR